MNQMMDLCKTGAILYLNSMEKVEEFLVNRQDLLHHNGKHLKILGQITIIFQYNLELFNDIHCFINNHSFTHFIKTKSKLLMN